MGRAERKVYCLRQNTVPRPRAVTARFMSTTARSKTSRRRRGDCKPRRSGSISTRYADAGATEVGDTVGDGSVLDPGAAPDDDDEARDRLPGVGTGMDSDGTADTMRCTRTRKDVA